MDWMDEVVRRRERACVSAAAVHLVMVAHEDAEARAPWSAPYWFPTASPSCGRCEPSATARPRVSTAQT